MNSKTQIAAGSNFYGLQLAPNGKIYSVKAPILSNHYLDVINNPNNPGISCNYADSAVYLNGHMASFGLPNFIDSYDYSNTLNDCETVGFAKEYHSEFFNVFPDPADNEITVVINGMIINAALTLYNSKGEPVLQIKKITQNSTSLEVSKLDSGIYFMLLTEDGKITHRKKLIISH